MTTKSPAFYIVDYLLGLSSTILNSFSDEHSEMGRMIYRDGLPIKLENSGKRAIVVTDLPASMYFPVTTAYAATISVRCYADHTRDINGLSAIDDGADRAWAMFGAIDKVLSAEQGASPIMVGDPFVQLNRVSQPLIAYDQEQNVPFLTINFDVAVMATA